MSGLTYNLPSDDLTRLYDFYFLTMHMNSTDDLIQYEIDYAREKNYTTVLDDLRSNVRWAVFSEIFYVVSTHRFWKSAIDAIESPPTKEYIRKYPATYDMKLLKISKEFDHLDFFKDLYAQLKDLSTGSTQSNYKERNDIIDQILFKHRNKVSIQEFIRLAKTLFNLNSLWTGRWSSFGGKKWGLICDVYLEIPEIEFSYKDHGKYMSIWIDQGFNIQHHNGTILDKLPNGTELKAALDFKKSVLSPKDFFDKISPSLVNFYKKL